MSYIKYIDVSEHQGVIDFEKVKGSVDGVIIRAGYGQGNIDRQFVRNVSECNRLGIPCGAYWFSYARTVEMAKYEADYLLHVLKPYKISLPVAFDWEYDSLNNAKTNGVNPTKQLVSDMARVFLNACEAAGYYAMNYTNTGLGKAYFDDQVWKRYDLWYAQWPSRWTESAVPQEKCGIWQFGGSTVPGISGSVDTNKAYKDYASIIAPKQKEYTDGDGVIIEPVKQETPKKPDTLAWAKTHGIVSGDTAQDKALADAFYAYHMAFCASDDKPFSGLLEV